MADAAELPPEMVAEILLRLPAKDLLHFRCVNKQWLSLIDDRNFILKHVQYMTGSAGAENHSIIILRSKKLYAMEMESPNRFRQLRPPPMISNSTIKLVGSCNGLLCFSSSTQDVFLLNPLTNDHTRLPIVPFELRQNVHHCRGRHYDSVGGVPVFGVGYDSITKDYKVVIIEGAIVEQYQDLRVYSLRTNSWRRMRHDRYRLRPKHKGKMGVCASNNLHWVMTRRSDSNYTRLIVAFDIRTEDYWEVPLPFYLGEGYEVDVAVLGGCLGMVVNYPHNKVADVWIMREYGSWDSWEKVLSVSFQEFAEHGGTCYLQPSYSAGQLLVERVKEKFFWFGAQGQSFRTFDIEDALDVPFEAEYEFINTGLKERYETFGSEVCAGSLVRVDIGV